ncbi:unnamed protein product [Rotaria socialis]
MLIRFCSDCKILRPDCKILHQIFRPEHRKSATYSRGSSESKRRALLVYLTRLKNNSDFNSFVIILYSSISFDHLHFLSQTLTTLDLSSNDIGALGAQHLADALQHNTTLTTLDLSTNDIGALGDSGLTQP